MESQDTLDVPREHQLAWSLRLLKRRHRHIALCVAFLLLFVATGAYAVLFVLGDHWLPGGMPDRVAAALRWAYWLSAAAWLVAAGGIPLVRRLHDLYAARLIERSHPEFRNTLVDAVQLARHRELPGSVRAAIVERAAQEVGQVDVLQSISTERLRRVMWANAGILVLFGIYAALAPKSAWVSAARAFGVRLASPTWTTVGEVLPPDGASVLRGESVRFAARLHGRAPAHAFVRFSLDQGTTWSDGQQLALRSAGGGQQVLWQAVKPGQDVQHSMLWQVVAGDATSPLRRLEVREFPEIASVTVRLDYPPYTRLAPATQPSGDIEAVAGTRATVTAIAKVNPHDPILVMGTAPNEHRRVLPAPVARAPRAIRAEFNVERDDTYCFEFRDAHGQPARHPIHWAIRARPDAPPRVEVVRPAQKNVTAFPHEAIDIRAEADDDYGLTRAVLMYRRTGDSAEVELPVSPQPPPGAGHAELAVRMDLVAIRAQPGDVIELWISAWDNREDGERKAAYQRGDSELRRIEIRSPEILAQAEPEPSPSEASARAHSPGRRKTPAAGTPGPPSETAQDAARPGEHETASRPARDAGATEAVSSEQVPGASESPSTRSGESADGASEAGQPREQSLEDFADAHARELEKLDEHYRGKELAEGSQGRPSTRPSDVSRPGATTRPGLNRVRSSSAPDRVDAPSRSAGEAAEGLDSRAQGPGGANENQDSRGSLRTPADPQGRENLAPTPDSSNGQTPEAASAPADAAEGPQNAGNGQGDPSAPGGGANQDSPSQSEPDGQSQDRQAPGSEPSPRGGAEVPDADHQGEGQGQNPGHGQGDGQEQGQGQGEGRGRGQAQRQALSEGQGQGEGQGPSGQGQEQGQSQGQTQGEGQCEGQGQAQGEGHGQGQGRGMSEGRTPGSGGKEVGGRGGTPRPGETPELPDQPADPGAPLNRPDAPAMGEAELKTRGRLDPLMDALERELRRGEVDPALLEDLGWTAAQARQFVESYRHVKRGGQKQTEHTDLPTQTETTDMGGSRNGPLLRGGRAGDTDARSMRATHERAPDATRELLEIGRQRVTPRYRSILHGYYRSLGTRPAADGSS